MAETPAEARDDFSDAEATEGEAGSPSTRPRGTDACVHLGLDQDPFVHYSHPSPDHRCYLWMQRDRIDLAHQEMFCLTHFSENCPWLSINLPNQKRAPRAVGSGGGSVPTPAETMAGEPWYSSLGPGLIALLAAIAHYLGIVAAALAPLLRQAAVWLWLGLCFLGRAIVWPVVWLSHHYQAIQAAAMRGLALAGRSLWKAICGVWRALRSEPAARLSPPRKPERPVSAATPTARAKAVVPTKAEATAKAASSPAAEPIAAGDYLRQGMEAVRDGDEETALALFRQATEADEKDEQAWLWRGALAANTEEKAECFRHALALNPYNARARAGLFQLGLPAEAVFAGGMEEAKPGDVTAGPSLGRPSPADIDDLAVTWDCPDCAAVNPRSASTCQHCGRPSPRMERELGARDGFVKGGLEALRSGNEELAYHYFSLAAETDPNDEKAWYWRAKTAPTLEEVIRCLSHIVENDPGNAKAKADLEWALKRQQREQARLAKAEAPPPAWRSTVWPRLVAPLRRALVQVASVCSFLLALLLSMRYVFSLTDLPSAPEYQPYLDLLPRFQMPPVLLGSGPGALDIGAALPLVLALLLFHAAFGLGDDGALGIRLWASLLAAAALLLLLLYLSNPAAAPLALLLAAAAIVSALAGDAHAHWQAFPRSI